MNPHERTKGRKQKMNLLQKIIMFLGTMYLIAAIFASPVTIKVNYEQRIDASATALNALGVILVTGSLIFLVSPKKKEKEKGKKETNQ